MFIFCSVKDMWAFGLIFFFLASLLGLGITWAKNFIFLLSLCFLLYGHGPFWLLIVPHHFVVSTTVLPFFLFLIISWAYWLMFLPCQHTSSSILYLGLSWPTFRVITSFGLIGQHYCHVSLFYHLIPWASLARLLLLYLFLLLWAYC